MINIDGRHARHPCFCFILIIHLMRYSHLVSTATWLLSEESHTDLTNSKCQSGAREAGGLFRIIENSKYAALHVEFTLHPGVVVAAASSKDCDGIELRSDERSVKFQMG